jgi:hypothetical protein
MKAHPDDSPISNYTDWEWHSSENEVIPSARSTARKNRREERAERYRESLGRMSRGGQLGIHVDADDDVY